MNEKRAVKLYQTRYVSLVVCLGETKLCLGNFWGERSLNIPFRHHQNHQHYVRFGPIARLQSISMGHHYTAVSCCGNDQCHFEILSLTLENSKAVIVCIKYIMRILRPDKWLGSGPGHQHIPVCGQQSVVILTVLRIRTVKTALRRSNMSLLREKYK